MASVPKKSRRVVSHDSKADSDDGSSSGFIRFEANVTNISPTGISSPKIEVLGTPWHLRLCKKDDSPFLRVYLHTRDYDSDIWSLDVSAEISLVNNVASKNEQYKFDRTFNHERYGFGSQKMIRWKTLINEEKGFIEDGKIIIESRFILSNLVGIRTNPGIDFSDSKDPFRDVALIIDGEKIYVSKQMLAPHSPVFKEMFCGDAAKMRKKEFKLLDIDRKEFLTMLRLIYPSNTTITDSNVESLLKLAERFQIKTIFDQVEQFLITSSTMRNILKFNLSDQYRLVKLQEHCLKTFKTIRDITDLKATEDYKSLSTTARAALLGIFDSSEPLVVEPTTALVPATGGTSIHTLTNTDTGKIVFKIDTTNPNEYVVKPSVYGFLDAGMSAQFQIIRQAGLPAVDKFRIQFAPAPEGSADAQEAFKGTTPAGKVTIICKAE